MCNVGWEGRLCEVPACPRNPATGEYCFGHGTCLSIIGQCYCDEGWTGVDCATPDCPGSPDCNARGTCDASFAPPTCQNCVGAWMGRGCEVPCVNGVQTPANSGVCRCDACYTGVSCDSVCSEHGTCGGGVCTCSLVAGNAWRGPLCTIASCPGSSDCAGRGQCMCT